TDVSFFEDGGAFASATQGLIWFSASGGVSPSPSSAMVECPREFLPAAEAGTIARLYSDRIFFMPSELTAAFVTPSSKSARRALPTCSMAPTWTALPVEKPLYGPPGAAAWAGDTAKPTIMMVAMTEASEAETLALRAPD